MKHTPKPLKAFYDSHNIHIATCERFPVTVGETFVSKDGRISREEAIANAKLWAAAPKLLEALRDTLEICLSRGAKLGLDDQGPVLDKAREALKEATQ